MTLPGQEAETLKLVRSPDYFAKLISLRLCNSKICPSRQGLNDYFAMTTHTYDGDDDDDIPKLPGTTIAALQEFYTERELSAKRFEELKAGVEETPQILFMNMFMEDWNASQFWVWFLASRARIGR